MPLNKSKGNMYDFVTHTWNPVKGVCYHNCSYCYMTAIRKRFNQEEKNPYLDESELKTNLGSGNFIFVGSSNDLFCESYPDKWIIKTLDHCEKFHDNKYLFQTKNPKRLMDFVDDYYLFDKSVVCTTIESNYHLSPMGNSPTIRDRVASMIELNNCGVDTYVTIEPVMIFDLRELVKDIRRINPVQVNIGADSGRNNLPEPSAAKVRKLISRLEEFTTVKQKSNLKRILKEEEV